ncbi:ABC transporter ATP-binding protein [Methylobacterium brachythecii]|uniref:ABC transporter ATP-binding protein n=1 Tax=Methylobacterium brachythecii TaxID=1176177 RepID=A0A7W6AMU3_9HYPH|nr:ABC transporter ATP-binding protein [Methylobacterium brachythecii]MBB3905516.1 branched-chain amino acid transport system ATP-binding protein [Methylobacterium brachythecii]GLS46828.1 ABC transporter ATP-binding protein [Methylobacterium brachythecii]
MTEAARRLEPGMGGELELRDVVSGYGAISVVKGVSLHVGPGEIVALLGKNGMGKTTTLKTILGMIGLRGGAISVDSVSVVGLAPSKLAALGVGYAPQEQPLFQDMSIRDNLRLAIASDRQLPAALESVFGYFPFLKDRLAQHAGTLSGGEQKMLILARALMLRPRLLLIDEITEGLQPSVIDKIASVLLNERKKSGVTILLVEQNLDFALKVADRWAVLKLGQIDDEGPAEPNERERVLRHLSV